MLSLQSDHELRRIIGLYGPSFQPDQWPPVCMPAGFSGAAIYRFTARTQQYALKIWPSGERSVSKLEALTRLLENITHNGITFIAPPVRKQDGTAATLSQSGFLVHIEPWLPGNSENSIPLSSQKQKNAFQALAYWHVAAADHVPNPEHLSWIRPAYHGKSPGLSSRKKKLERYLKNGLVTENRKSQMTGKSASLYNRLQDCFLSQAAPLWDRLQQASQIVLPLQPVLRDIWRDHVLFTGDQVSGLIDPAEFGTDSVVTDITRLLGSVVGNHDSLRDEALQSYHAVRPLNPTEQNQIEIFDHSNLLLSAIGCFERSLTVISTPDNFPADAPARLSDRLEEYLNRLETSHS